MQAIKEYDVRIDNKKRVTLRGAKYSNYHVFKYPNGQIVLEPRDLVAPFDVSEKSFSMMDTAIVNFKKGKASKTVHLSGFRTSRTKNRYSKYDSTNGKEDA